MATSVDVESAIREVVGERMAQPGFYPDEHPAPPYVNFMPYEYDLSLGSDRVWLWREAYDVVLCTRYRDKALERRLYDALDARGVVIKELSASADFDEGLYYFEVFTEPVDTEVQD